MANQGKDLTSFVFEGDAESIMHMKALEGTGLILHQKNLIICTTCHQATENPLRHLEKNHQTLKFISKESRKEIEKLRDRLGTFEIPQDQRSIHGLLCFNGWCCEICGFLSKTSNGLEVHHSRNHKHESIGWIPTLFQEIGQTRFKVFFFSSFLFFSFLFFSFLFFSFLFFSFLFFSFPHSFHSLACLLACLLIFILPLF